MTVGWIEMSAVSDISVVSRANVWAVADGKIVRLGVRAAGTRWEPMAPQPGATMRRVAASADGGLAGIDSDGMVWVCQDGTWKASTTAATAIAAGPYGTLWAIGTTGEVMRCLNGAAWTKIAFPGPAVDIAVSAPNGAAYGLSESSRLYICEGMASVWQEVPTDGALIGAIGIGNPDLVLGITAGAACRLTKGQWEPLPQIPGATLTRISAASDGSIWSLTAARAETAYALSGSFDTTVNDAVNVTIFEHTTVNRYGRGPVVT